ncbi:hypothetical protein [Gemmatimonas phototrophica]|uniref:Uncharacterized protein n=1 Tax=Gemmatimonas phototrophica TaxID=1379270 RepID=A0A143BIU8_9BACT|nr:hypothetical protein [Gemmatimonas phototrophica]AMW04472.1 hypothetical protein GEMMAAP_05695 [Gemmatimonas phototrophica]
MTHDTAPTNLARLTLPILVAQWSRIVDYVERHQVAEHDFRTDVDVRHEIALRLRAKPTTRETREMLVDLDEQFRGATVASEVCLHGAERATEEGWSPVREWYYWRTTG